MLDTLGISEYNANLEIGTANAVYLRGIEAYSHSLLAPQSWSSDLISGVVLNNQALRITPQLQGTFLK